MPEEKYSFQIEGFGVKITKNLNKEVGDKIVLLAVTEDVRPSSKISAHSSTLAEKDDTNEKSIQELIIEFEAKRNPDKITTMAYYLKNYQSQMNFSIDDIKELYEAAAETLPSYITRDLKWAVKNGWIANKIGDKDIYYITSNGSKAVEGKFSTDILKKTSAKKLNTKKTKKKSNNQ